MKAESLADVELHTDRAGSFELRLPMLDDRTYDAEVFYDGDEFHERALVRRALDLRRSDVRLEVDAPAEVDLGTESHAITVVARGPGGGASLLLFVEDELGRGVAQALTDAGGRAEMELRSSKLGPPGAGRLTVRTDGDSARGSARTEVPILRTRATHLDLLASPAAIEVGAPVRLSGTLHTTAGPLSRRAVGIYRNETHLATVLTGTEGGFEFEWTADRSGDHAEFVARFTTDSPGLPSCESEPVVVAIANAPLGPIAWSVLPLLALGLGLFAWRRRLVVAPPAPSVRVRPGVDPRVVARTVRATSFRVSGEVVAHRGERRLTSGVEIVDSAERVDRKNLIDGRFDFELPEGRHRLRFVASGHIPVEVEVQIPHRGQWVDFRVRLETWRARALAIAGRVGAAILGRRWEKTTVHELSRHPQAPEPVRAVATEAAQMIYGPNPPSGEAVEALDERARKAEPPNVPPT
jgi:hypothetical protein